LAAIWHLCQCISASEMTYIVSGGALNSTHSFICVNALTTDYEIRRNDPLMQHPRTLGRLSRAGVTPARDGRPRVRGRLVSQSVSRWYQISHAIQVRRFIHLGDAHSKQWAALNASSLWEYLVNALDNIHEVHLWLI